MEHAIQLVVFDWAGTTTDFGSQAPVQVFDRTFAQFGLRFARDEVNAPMGMEKKAHIRSMLSTPGGRARWMESKGADWDEEDVERIYRQFEKNLRQVVAEYSHPISGVVETVGQLRAQEVKIGSTTGYTSEMMAYVSPVAAEEGYAPDCVVTPDVTGCGRPTPFMLYECMRRAGVYPPSRVVKVGDTAMDILEGKNAGAWAIGILVGSNLMGFSQSEYETASAEDIRVRKARAEQVYLEAGADLVIDTIRDLPAALEHLNARMAKEVHSL